MAAKTVNELLDIKALALAHAAEPGIDRGPPLIRCEITKLDPRVVGEQINDLAKPTVIDAAVIPVPK